MPSALHEAGKPLHHAVLAVAIDIFRAALPPVQFNLFAWESLRPEETSYFDHEGNEKRADLVFTVKLKKNRKAANPVMLLDNMKPHVFN